MSARAAPQPVTGLRFDGLTKRYGAVTVLDDVSLHLRPGRVHALMGENGAGKSTLIKLIAGVVRADSMAVSRDGAPLRIASVQDAAAAGFRFIHQELTVVPQLTVAENILLSHATPKRFGLFLDWPALRDRARAALAALGVDHIDPGGLAGDLGTGDRMVMRLASALVADPGADRPCLYVLDEPTAALQQAEVERLFGVIRTLRTAGAALLYVSHRMAEITALCDDVTVLRNGRRVSSCALAETSRDRIVRDMTGTAERWHAPAIAKGTGTGDAALSLRDVGSPALHGLTFDLCAGEVLGIAGLAGAGQTALLRLCLGAERLVSGQAACLGGALPGSPTEAWRRGIAYVPLERRSEGLMMDSDVRANVMLPHLRGARASKRRETARTRTLATQVALTSRGPDQPVTQLSGGNQQKVVFARALAGSPRLLLLDDPTRGVDVGARADLHDLIRTQGCATLLASSDLDELLALSHRVLVLQDGRQTALRDAAGLTAADLSRLVQGADATRPAA